MPLSHDLITSLEKHVFLDLELPFSLPIQACLLDL